MRIKTGEHEEDDLQLIDGVSVISLMEVMNSRVFTSRIIGVVAQIDISAARMDSAVEATVQVLVSESARQFRSEPRTGLKRYVVAVEHREKMYLKFKVGTGSSSSSEHCCSFTAQKHGHVDRLVETDFASISVKVTWSVLPDSWECKIAGFLKSRA
ncbi:hypothetical protein HU200_043970 [Digitaria exilis]|uniref:DUF6598 domain-containing protein n=1 Tax=Digitaria exilis TaxID=1010633 RepID=A0A835EDB9_9POAL|nr:hypothetical protein HU200_043970 [Digitaria exilis]